MKKKVIYTYKCIPRHQLQLHPKKDGLNRVEIDLVRDFGVSSQSRGRL